MHRSDSERCVRSKQYLCVTVIPKREKLFAKMASRREITADLVIQP